MNILLGLITQPYQTIETHRYETPATLALGVMFLVWATALASAWWGSLWFLLVLTLFMTMLGLVGHLAYVGLIDWTMQLFAQKSRFSAVASWLALCYLPISFGITLTLLARAIAPLAWILTPLNIGLLIWSILLAIKVLKTHYQIGTGISLLLLGLPILISGTTIILMLTSLVLTVI